MSGRNWDPIDTITPCQTVIPLAIQYCKDYSVPHVTLPHCVSEIVMLITLPISVQYNTIPIFVKSWGIVQRWAKFQALTHRKLLLYLNKEKLMFCFASMRSEQLSVFGETSAWDLNFPFLEFIHQSRQSLEPMTLKGHTRSSVKVESKSPYNPFCSVYTIQLTE